MINTYNIHAQWQPLKTLMIGRVYDSGYYRNITNSAIKDSLMKIAEESEEDIQNIIKVLEGLGVSCIRPTAIDDDIMNYIDGSGKLVVNDSVNLIPRPPIMPRDAQLVIGDTLYTVGQDHPAIMQGIREHMDGPIVNFPSSRFNKYPNINAPSLTQIGKDLYVDSMSFNRVEYQWIHNKFKDYRVNTLTIGGHNDGAFVMLKPGVGLSLKHIARWDTAFPNWDILQIEDDKWGKCKEFLDRRDNNQGRWWVPGEESNTEFASFVDNWLTNWVGYIRESVFSINLIIVNESTILVNGYNQVIFEFLKKHDIEPIICPFRHQYFWDGGLHCITLDLHREGSMVDYFPNRTTPVIDEGFED